MITTITTTAAEDTRLATAFGTYLGLGRNATALEVKVQVAAWLTQIVHDQETRAAQAAIIAAQSGIQPPAPIAPAVT